MPDIDQIPALSREDAAAVRSAQDAADAIRYAFAVPHLTRSPVKPIFLGVDWPAGFGDTGEASDG